MPVRVDCTLFMEIGVLESGYDDVMVRAYTRNGMAVAMYNYRGAGGSTGRVTPANAVRWVRER